MTDDGGLHSPGTFCKRGHPSSHSGKIISFPSPTNPYAGSRSLLLHDQFLVLHPAPDLDPVSAAVLLRVHRPIRDNQPGRSSGKDPVAQEFHVKIRCAGPAHPRYHRPADPARLRQQAHELFRGGERLCEKSCELPGHRRRDLHRAPQRREDTGLVFHIHFREREDLPLHVLCQMARVREARMPAPRTVRSLHHRRRGRDRQGGLCREDAGRNNRPLGLEDGERRRRIRVGAPDGGLRALGKGVLQPECGRDRHRARLSKDRYDKTLCLL